MLIFLRLGNRVSKGFKRHQGMYFASFCKDVARMLDWGCGAHNRGHLHESCKCKRKKKGFYTSSPRYHPDKSYKYNKKHGYHKFEKINPSKFRKSQSKHYVKRRTERKDKDTCFIYGQKGHWPGKCPTRNYKPRLASLCSKLDPHLWRYSSSF